MRNRKGQDMLVGSELVTKALYVILGLIIAVVLYYIAKNVLRLW